MAVNHAGPLKVTIVGAGLGGLACAIACHRRGFDVMVLEQAREFLRIGDSIGLGSNSARLLRRWGLGEELDRINTRIDNMEIYNFDSSDKVLGVDTQVGEAEDKYGCMPFIGHRGDIHQLMADYCKKLGVPVKMATTVTEYDDNKPSVTLANGQEVTSDVIICADGVKSKGRHAVLGYEDKPIHSGYAIYRGYVDAKAVSEDPLTAKFVKQDKIRLFLAPDMHCIITTLRNGSEVNAVLTHKDTADIEEGWNKPGDKADVLRILESWDPAVRRVWENMNNSDIIDWKLIYRPCLPQWVSESGLVALMGDAAHPFLPTSVQGASQAIEDAATLATCLSKVNRGGVALALHSYFDIRHDYVAEAQQTGISQRNTWHDTHDRESKRFKEEFNIQKVSQNNFHLWANDAEDVVETKWDEVSKKVAQRLARTMRLEIEA
ncbi:salicylate hydroxylase [Dactylonectria macrodidyma]|uniref:Salicylate hydroxylase n=1 Tax=Dactylonectria macrodidyma TaxID=307937 RepID=A0A9P9F896_9HYPO|nr:salicylate hydroxylase [Dactylonectria macrodidyma]